MREPQVQSPTLRKGFHDLKGLPENAPALRRGFFSEGSANCALEAFSARQHRTPVKPQSRWKA